MPIKKRICTAIVMLLSFALPTCAVGSEPTTEAEVAQLKADVAELRADLAICQEQFNAQRQFDESIRKRCVLLSEDMVQEFGQRLQLERAVHDLTGAEGIIAIIVRLLSEKNVELSNRAQEAVDLSKSAMDKVAGLMAKDIDRAKNGPDPIREPADEGRQ